MSPSQKGMIAEMRQEKKGPAIFRIKEKYEDSLAKDDKWELLGIGTY